MNANIEKINGELKQYREDLSDRIQVLVVNKMDLLSTKDKINDMKKQIDGLGMPVCYVSSITHEGIENLITTCSCKTGKCERCKCATTDLPGNLVRIGDIEFEWE